MVLRGFITCVRPDAHSIKELSCNKQTPHTAHIATPISTAGSTVFSSSTAGSSVSSSSTPSPTPPPFNMSFQDTFFLNGKLYGPVQTLWNSAFISSLVYIAKVSSPDATLYLYHAFLATVPDLSFPATLSASSSELPSFLFHSSLPFIINTGASCHIFPVLLDFKSIFPIKPHPITDLGDHSVAAVGMGTIELHMLSGALTLPFIFLLLLFASFLLQAAASQASPWTWAASWS
ncbi:hypothetical protein BGY98DRAFT_1099617 [Russula aff. rugulosa BPL654]|nr:hypothetical protein BGY98DRAFT_1099617 [Russula aff. rugulosa BPL654]